MSIALHSINPSGFTPHAQSDVDAAIAWANDEIKRRNLEYPNGSKCYRAMTPQQAAALNMNVNNAPVLAITYYDIRGTEVMTRARLSVPIPDSKKPTKSQRYTQPPGTKVEVFFDHDHVTNWAQVADDTTIPISIPEGELKATTICAKTKHVALALGGVWNFKQGNNPTPLLQQINWKDRTVYIIFDSDLPDNRSLLKEGVALAEVALCKMLSELGARVIRCRVGQCAPPSVDGQKYAIDDHLNSGGVMEDVFATGQLWSSVGALSVDTLPLGDSTTFDTTIVTTLVQAAAVQTQEAVAEAFAKVLKGKLLFAAESSQWFEWDGTRWCAETTNKAYDFARQFSKIANSARNERGLATSSFYAGVERIARTDRAFAISQSIFDYDNYALNTPVGTIDLRSGVMRQHDPNDRISKCTAVAPSAEGGERFLRFLVEITGGDKEVVQFLKVSLGSMLSGAVENHWLMFWIGKGRNGKNTLGDAVMHVFGDYAIKIPSTTLMEQSKGGHPTEVAQLQGSRLAVASEVKEQSFFDESRILELTGDTRLKARFMRENFFEFERTFKFLIYGNSRPQIRSAADSIKSRLKIVPFTQSFIDREDPDLPDKLKESSSFILHWLLEGHAEWVANGKCLPKCEAVEKEVAEYFMAQSTVETFMNECTIISKHDIPVLQCVLQSDLFAVYQCWKGMRNEHGVALPKFKEALRAMGLETGSSGGVRVLRTKINKAMEAEVFALAEHRLSKKF
jgi:P4 family phage/plasmid primase-like protien